LQIDPSAEPFHAGAVPQTADGQRVGVLLSQGFTGSPASMRPWGEFLASKGYTVAVPRLPGHGTTWQDLNTKTWADWCDELTQELDKLRANCDQVVVGGLSMGGALALRLAADRGRDVAGVILVNPAVNIARADVKLVPVLKHVVASRPGITNDIKKPGVDEHGYSRVPLRALHSMLQGFKTLCADLPEVTQPVLLVRSAVDHVVDPSSARIIKGSVSSRDYTEITLEDSYHVATLDNDQQRVFDESLAFVRRVTGP
jgi:carboxylesterase